MPRDMSPDMLSAMSATELRCVLFVYAQFLSGPVYLWTGYGPVTWNGQTWQGIGTLLQVSSIEEGADVNARGIALTLSGFDANLLPLALGEVQQGLPVVVYLGLLYPGTPPVTSPPIPAPYIIPDPLIAWAGRMDQPTIDVMGTTATISITCENRLAAMNVAVDRRYTPEDQNRDWPGDLGMAFVYSIQNCNIYWGRLPGTSNQV